MKQNNIKKRFIFIGIITFIVFGSCKVFQSSSKNEIVFEGDWLIYSNQWGQGDLINRIYQNDGIFIDIYYTKVKPIKAFYEKGGIVADTFKIKDGVLYYKINNIFSPFLSKYAFIKSDTICDYRGQTVKNPLAVLEGSPCYEPYFKYKEGKDTIFVYSDINKNSKLYLEKKNFFGIEFNPRIGISAYYNGRAGKSSLVSAKDFGYPR